MILNVIVTLLTDIYYL